MNIYYSMFYHQMYIKVSKVSNISSYYCTFILFATCSSYVDMPSNTFPSTTLFLTSQILEVFAFKEAFRALI